MGAGPFWRAGIISPTILPMQIHEKVHSYLTGYKWIVAGEGEPASTSQLASLLQSVGVSWTGDVT